MAPVQNWASTPKFTEAVISTANSNVDGTGTIVSFVTAGTYGTRVDRIVVQALGTTTAGKVHIFKRTSAGTWRFYMAVLVTAITPNATTAHFRYAAENLTIDLEVNQELGAAPLNAESFLVFGEGSSY
jgi:hypothetical protein